MQAISQKDKKFLLSKPQKCERCGVEGVQWHHVFIYSGKQIKDWYNIALACPKCHDQATPHNPKYKQDVREYFERLLLKQHFEKFVYFYPKNNWAQLYNYLFKTKR